MAELRKYGAGTTIVFPLVARDLVDFKTSAPFAAGDVKIAKDEGAFANTATTTPTEEGQGMYSLPLSATEMQAARIMIVLIDQTVPKAWEDQAILIDTYGHASAQHELDLDDGTLDVNVASMSAGVITASAIAADAIGASELAADAVTEIQSGLATAAALATVQADTDDLQSRIPAALVGGRMDANIAAAVAQSIADELLKRAISNVEGAAPSFRSLYGAVAALVNRRRISGSNLEVYKTDDATVLATIAATTDAGQEPITELDP